MHNNQNTNPPTTSKLILLFLAARPNFLLTSALPILVGSALAYATTSSFNPLRFCLALFAIILLHAGSNVANDYFDHLSKNDWLNKNPTPFSGGRRFIQQNTLSPKSTLLLALTLLTAGAIIGIILVILTQSLFILTLGLVGLLGGFFYTAPPIKLGYRAIGEFVIALLFGILPIFGAYFLQTQTFDTVPIFPALLVAILIFLVILINEFPDSQADDAVNKRTLVVHFGIPKAVWIYRIALLTSYLLAVAAIPLYRLMFFPAILYILTLPIAALALKAANPKDLSTPGQYRASKFTVLLHAAGCLALTAGFLLYTLQSPAI